MKNNILIGKDMVQNTEFSDVVLSSGKAKECNICPRQCGADRYSNFGYCKSKGLRIARFGLHMWEEPCISGTEGSGTIFFSGCSLRCVYCQNYSVSQLSKGKDISVHELADVFKKLEDIGANNINLVTPTHFADQIIEALNIYKPSIPVCYNTSGYERVETIKKLNELVDIFLTDFKYAHSSLADEFSKASDYPIVAQNAILQMRENIPQDTFDYRGIMLKGLIVRHLVLPNCLQNSKDVLSWIKENLGTDTIISIMSQYTPYGKALGNDKIGRKLKPIEYKIVVAYAQKLGFDNAFIQDCESADDRYIPEFFGETLSME